MRHSCRERRLQRVADVSCMVWQGVRVSRIWVKRLCGNMEQSRAGAVIKYVLLANACAECEVLWHGTVVGWRYL